MKAVPVLLLVLLLHAAGLWALQSGLLMRAVESVVAIEVLSDWVEPPKPERDLARPLELPRSLQKTKPLPTQAVAAPAVQPVALADSTPALAAPVGVVTPQAAPAPIGVPVAANAAPATALAPAPKVELPSSDADYLHNPKPAYPRLSRQRAEQGRVQVRVYIGVDGTAQKAEIQTSSGFERLDQAALATARSWRYVPGRQGGVAQAMWFSVPIQFVLE